MRISSGVDEGPTLAATTEGAGRAEPSAETQEAAMTARQFRVWAERLIIALLVVAAIVVVVREPGRIVTAIIDDPWSNILTIVLSGALAGFSAGGPREMIEGPPAARGPCGVATRAFRPDRCRSTSKG